MNQAVLTFVALMSGCATTVDPKLVEARVREDASSRSAPYCAKFTKGCEIDVHQHVDGRWSALVTPLTYSDDGRRVVGIDSDDFYSYGRDGTFTSALRNYK
jgi:hypothetical protein